MPSGYFCRLCGVVQLSIKRMPNVGSPMSKRKCCLHPGSMAANYPTQHIKSLTCPNCHQDAGRTCETALPKLQIGAMESCHASISTLDGHLSSKGNPFSSNFNFEGLLLYEKRPGKGRIASIAFGKPSMVCEVTAGNRHWL